MDQMSNHDFNPFNGIKIEYWDIYVDNLFI